MGDTSCNSNLSSENQGCAPENGGRNRDREIRYVYITNIFLKIKAFFMIMVGSFWNGGMAFRRNGYENLGGNNNSGEVAATICINVLVYDIERST